LEKLNKWKNGLEEKGLRVNLGKTKIMRCQYRTGQVENSGKFPCSVCKRGVGANSIQCTACNLWVHKRCSSIKGKLQSATSYSCKKCVDGRSENVESRKEIQIGLDKKVECVNKFCYLGDTIGVGGGAKEVVRARVRCAWAKFKELAPVLTSRGASLKVKGNVYKACVQRVLVLQ